MKPGNRSLCLCLLSCAVLGSCGAPGPPMPPSLELAKPVSDLRAVRKGNRVYLTWTVPSRTTERMTVRHPGVTRVCRSVRAEVTDCKKPTDEIPPDRFPLLSSQPGKSGETPRIQANYIDTLPPDVQSQDPTAEVNYAVSVLNQAGRSAGLSNQASVPSAPTLPPPQNFSARVGGDGILLSWDCASPGVDTPGLRHKMRIYRREQGQATESKIAEPDLTLCSSATSASQFLDQTFEWQKRYDYRATVATIVSEPGKPDVGIEGDDTPVTQVFANDVFPPSVPTGLQAVFSGVGQALFIDLVWSPDSEPDLAGYNVFRRERNSEWSKLNLDLVRTPAYRDTSVQSGREYFYSVSAIDERGNESRHSEEAGETVP